MRTLFLYHIRALLAAALLPLVAAVAAESSSVLLQKGIYAEEIERNLDSAIKIYEQIAAEAASNQAVVAQAQYRLAVCYQKQGKKEQAIRLLNELVQQPTTTGASVSAKARQALVELGIMPSEAVSVRRISLAGNPGWIASVSPDGRLAAYQPWDSNELIVQDLATGHTRIIAKDAEMWGHSPPARFSPDGQWIGYDFQEAGIHVTKIDGSETRVLFAAKSKDGKDHWNEFAGWSADGMQAIMAQWDYTRNCRVAVALDLTTGSAKEIFSTPTHNSTAQWSIAEGGRYVARCSDQLRRTTALLDVRTGHEEVILDHDAHQVVGWTDGDKKLVYAKNGSRGLEIMVLEVKEGKSIGAPKLLFTDTAGVFAERPAGRAVPLGVTRDGRIFYAMRRSKPQPAELWVLEGFLPKNSAGVEVRSGPLEIPPTELIVGNDNAIFDRKVGFSATMPAGWNLRNADRRKGTESILSFAVSGIRGALPRIVYNLNSPWEVSGPGYPLKEMGPKPTTPTEIDAWLRKWQQAHTQASRDGRSTNYAGYETRPASITTRMINGHRAITWTADYKRNDENCLEVLTFVFSETANAFAWIQVPAANAEAAVSAYEGLVASIRFSKPEI